MYDEVPGETPKHPRPFIPNHTASSAIYRTHVYEPKGGVEPVKQVNQSQLRQRGWQVGSLQTKGGEPDRYWLHSGHPLNPRAYGDDGSKPLRYATVRLPSPGLPFTPPLPPPNPPPRPSPPPPLAATKEEGSSGRSPGS
jgi:hypothetical protein